MDFNKLLVVDSSISFIQTSTQFSPWSGEDFVDLDYMIEE